MDIEQFNQLLDVNKEIKYSSAVKSRLLGNPTKQYRNILPITTNTSNINGTVITFRLSSENAFIDTSELELLYSISPTFTGGGSAYLESSAAPFRQIVVRSVGGQELSRINYYNKLNNIMRRAKMNNPASLSREATSTDNSLTFGSLNGAAGVVSTLTVASGEYSAITNSHYAIATGGTLNTGMALRGVGPLSLTSGENAKFFPLCLSGGIEIDFVLETDASQLFRAPVATSAITALISSMRLKVPFIEYDGAFVQQMREAMRQAGGLIFSTHRWFVQSYNSNAQNLNLNVGLIADSIRGIYLFNDSQTAVNNPSYCAVSTSPYMALTQFYTVINGQQYPQVPIQNDDEVYAYANDALGGFTGAIDRMKWRSLNDSALSLVNGGITYDAANAPSCWIAGLDCDAVPSSVYMAGKRSGSQQVQLFINRTEGSARNVYVAMLYDVVNKIDASNGTISQVSTFPTL